MMARMMLLIMMLNRTVLVRMRRIVLLIMILKTMGRVKMIRDDNWLRVATE